MAGVLGCQCCCCWHETQATTNKTTRRVPKVKKPVTAVTVRPVNGSKQTQEHDTKYIIISLNDFLPPILF